MSNIKEKISASIDKLTHRHGNTSSTGNTGTTTGTGVGSDYNQSSMGSAGTGAGTTGAYDTTGAGIGQTGTGIGQTGTGIGQTSTGITGTTGYETGTTGTLGGTTGQTGTINASEIIDSKTFTKTEDHEVLIEKKRYELEHRPVEKQYVVETRFVGERRVEGAPVEIVGKETREVDERVVQAPRGDRTVIVQDVDVPAGEVMTGTTTGITGQSGMGQGQYDSTTGAGRQI